MTELEKRYNEQLELSGSLYNKLEIQEAANKQLMEEKEKLERLNIKVLENTKNSSKKLQKITIYITLAIALLTGVQGVIMYKQNELIISQNNLFDKQNNLVENQNQQIENQSFLAEAERISDLDIVSSNLLDNINEELKENTNNAKSRRLSISMAGRIAALSHYLRPYQYMEGGKLIKRPISPERGLLLMSILNYKLSNQTLDSIYAYSDFRQVDLKGVKFPAAYFQSLNLRGSNLRGANFKGANFRGVDLRKANLRGAFLLSEERADFSKLNNGFVPSTNLERCDFTGANLADTDLRGVNLTNAELIDTDFVKAKLRAAFLQGSDLKGADLTNANLQNAKLQGAKNITYDQLIKAKTLYKTKGIPDSIRARLNSDKPSLFDKPK